MLCRCVLQNVRGEMTSENASNLLHFLRLVFVVKRALRRERRLRIKRAQPLLHLKAPRAFSRVLVFRGGVGVPLKAREMVDFEGQKFVENFTVSVVTSTAFVGFLLGYALQDYTLMRNVIFCGILISTVVTLPSWPFLKRHPIRWREIDEEHPSAKEEEEEEEEEEAKKDEKENVLKRLIRRFFV